MWKTGLSKITVKGNAVSFDFSGQAELPGLGHQHLLVPIVPAAHLDELQRDRDHDRQHRQRTVVGTGPFTYGAGKGTSGTLQWNRRSDWWATKALGMKMPMQYIVDIHNTPNTASLQNFLQDNIDLSNNFFPGIDKVLGGKVQTYYPKAPYMLSANTAWLVPNTTHEPLNDVAFRRALASRSTSTRSSRPTTATSSRRRTRPASCRPGASGSTRPRRRSSASPTTSPRAKSLLAAPATRTRTVTATSRTRTGRAINLRLIVPNGWSDWMTAIQIIAASAKDAGIKITPAFPDYNGLVDERNSGKFDLVINNDKQLGNTPYTYYDYLFHLPIADTQTFANYSRFTRRAEAVGADAHAQQGQPGERGGGEGDPLADPEVHPRGSACDPALVQRDVVAVQHDVLDELPEVHGPGLQNTPTVWNGYLNMTGIDALAKLKPKQVGRDASDSRVAAPPPGCGARGCPPAARQRPSASTWARTRATHRREPLSRPQDRSSTC